jgi:hypothetical protein
MKDKIRDLIFYTTFVRNVSILRRTERGMIKNIYYSSCIKYLLFLSDFNVILISSTDFRKMLNIPNFMKIRQVVAELFHANIQPDRRT